MDKIEQYIEKLKKSDKMYHWPIERYQKALPDRQRLISKYPAYITLQDHYDNLDDWESWCYKQFGPSKGECNHKECEFYFDHWDYIEHYGDRNNWYRQIHDLWYSKDYEGSFLIKKLKNHYGNFLHYDLSINEKELQSQHCHTGTWERKFIMKTGYDYGFQDFYFENIEDAVYFKIEISSYGH